MAHIVFPLTLTQNDIYLDQCRRGHSPLYNVGGYIQLSAIDEVQLALAHKRLVSEHDVFGLRIQTNGAGVAQTVSDIRTITLEFLDFSKQQHATAAADGWQTALFETAFDLHDAELFRAILVKIADDHYRYVGIAHHLLMDGWGFSNWAKRLCQLYNDPSSPSDTVARWQEVVREDEEYVGSEKYLADKNYWTGQMQNPVSLFSPRYLRLSDDPMSVRSRRRTIRISRTELDELRVPAKAAGASVSHHFLAMLAVYFANSSEQDSLVFGLPFHNRKNHRHKQMLGVFTSISPLCVDMRDSSFTFGDLVRYIGRQQKACFRHQRYPLGHIVRDLAERSSSQRSLYDVGFNHLKISGELSFQSDRSSLTYLSHNHEATPLMVTLCEYGELGPVELQLDYNLAYFDDADSVLLADRLSFLMQSVRGAYGTRVTDLEILPEHERCRLLQGFGDGPLPDISSGCIHHLFERQVRCSPHAVAVSAEEGSLTYAELNMRANRLAHYLADIGIKPESLVGVLMERGVDVLTGVLGILKAGAAYVPLDQSHPPQRIQTILEDGDIRFVVGHRHLSGEAALRMVQFVAIDEILADSGLSNANPDSEALGLTASNLAYVIYTSGSTGRPKGVPICHSNAVSFLDWVRSVYTTDELARVLASTSLSFDLSIFEMFAPLSVGGMCAVVKDALALLTNRVDVSLINTVPSAIKVLIEQNAIPPGVRVVNLAGEPLPMHVVNDLLAGHRCEKVFNLYGPSEDTTYSTYALFEMPITGSPHIGKAIAGTHLYVLSPRRKLTPIGDIGELHIAGSGLSRGYLNSPGLTAEKFVCNPFSSIEGDRLYGTGDLVRYRADGVLEYLGRGDSQVKIRGFRIELGEIERQLELLDQVKTAVVLVRENGPSGKYLSAYVERRQEGAVTEMELDNETWVQGLRPALRNCLPDYMVPASISVLHEMPLTSNGKVNKKTLMALCNAGPSRHNYVAPATDTEIRVAEMWAGLLGVAPDRVGATTSLFDLGGHSLLLVRLANNVRVEMGVSLSMRVFCDALHIRDLATRIDIETRLRRIDRRINLSEIVSEGYI
jgi:amino acid adenylation domain-containing protein